MTNVGKFDGLPVEAYAGRFSGSFEIDPEVGEHLAYDDVVTFVVVGVVGKVGMGSNKNGEIKRTNTFEVTNVNILPSELAYQVYNMVNDGEVPAAIAGIATPTNDMNDDDIDYDTSDWDDMVADAGETFVVKFDPTAGASSGPNVTTGDAALADFMFGNN